MLFKPDLICRIYSRSSQEVRDRVAAALDLDEIIEARGRVAAKTMTRRRGAAQYYQLGRIYAVQPGRGKHGVGQIEITVARQERLGDITSDDAHREGFASVEQFFAYWDALYGAHDPEELVWVYGFTPVDQPALPLDLSAAAATDDGI